MTTVTLDPDDVDVLFDLATRSIDAGLAGRSAPRVETDELPHALRAPRGVFVTVDVDHQLNGCIGAIEPDEPLGAAVARLAWESAFADPRLPPLRADQRDRVTVQLSLLTEPQPIDATSEQRVIDQLRPGVDGLVLAAGARRATYLPSVWKALPDARSFVRELERKAGLRAGEWPPRMQAATYQSESYERALAST